MLHWSLIFFVAAIVAALLGFGGIAQGAVGIARVLAFIFLVAFLASVIWRLVTGRSPARPPQ
ncbi:MAG: hypothetical protein FD180_988 [Planctomycetota bacterium]|nr:MAG: hypothetical protein FD180_988 [Planctomycetota bacterium]